MLRVSILNDQGLETNAGIFATEAELNEWYDYNLEYFPKPHTKTVLSLVEEKLKLQRQQESEDALNLGFKLLAKIRSMNRRKLKLGLWTSTKFNQLLSNPVGSQIERALWNGSLTTAAYLITNLSDFYSDIEIQEIITDINAHEAKWSYLI
jgi:hypothetical protein